MKTAISIPDDIFNDINRLSKELHCSRSQILTNAAKEYIEKLKNKKMLEALNRVYAEDEKEPEAKIRRKGKENYARRIKAEEW